MTDYEIIRCLRHCRAGDCENCKALNVCDATFSFHKDAIDLINHQKAKIKALQMDNKQLQSDVINANQNLDNINGLLECEKEKVDIEKQKVICACKMLKSAKSESIKEFARRLKCGVPQETGVIRCSDIDNLVKEMTE